MDIVKHARTKTTAQKIGSIKKQTRNIIDSSFLFFKKITCLSPTEIFNKTKKHNNQLLYF